MAPEDLLTPHFTLRELLPRGHKGEVPAEILAALLDLTEQILEPARALLGSPMRVTSGWRPADYNEKVGGEKLGDHPAGRAADVQGIGSGGVSWELKTIQLFHAIRVGLEGEYGQLILEDHRKALSNPGKLWVHVARPSKKHPGFGGDLNMVLLSPAPKVYRPFDPEDLA